MSVSPRALNLEVVENTITLEMSAFPYELALKLPPTRTLIQQRQVVRNFSEMPKWTLVENIRVGTVLSYISASKQKLEKGQ